MAIIKTANDILTRYQRQGYRVTLRQLYYVFIAQDLFPADWIDTEYNAKQGLQADTKNTVKNYKRLGGIVNDGRLRGLIDWAIIEDRVRIPKPPREYDSLEDLVEAALYSFRLPRWKDQEYYAELWVEKDALSGVLQPLAEEYHVTLMVNRGYSSQSAMYEAGKRFAAKDGEGYITKLFYLGDHDPSGEDMVQDIQGRLRMYGSEVNVKKVALTMPQIDQYSPPPNPVKSTDSRAPKYEEAHGSESWEVDALPPEVLHEVIRAEFDQILDVEKMDAIKEHEEHEKKLLIEAVKHLRKKGK